MLDSYLKQSWTFCFTRQLRGTRSLKTVKLLHLVNTWQNSDEEDNNPDSAHCVTALRYLSFHLWYSFPTRIIHLSNRSIPFSTRSTLLSSLVNSQYLSVRSWYQSVHSSAYSQYLSVHSQYLSVHSQYLLGHSHPLVVSVSPLVVFVWPFVCLLVVLSFGRFITDR